MKGKAKLLLTSVILGASCAHQATFTTLSSDVKWVKGTSSHVFPEWVAVPDWFSTEPSRTIPRPPDNLPPWKQVVYNTDVVVRVSAIQFLTAEALQIFSDNLGELESGLSKKHALVLPSYLAQLTLEGTNWNEARITKTSLLYLPEGVSSFNEAATAEDGIVEVFFGRMDSTSPGVSRFRWAVYDRLSEFGCSRPLRAFLDGAVSMAPGQCSMMLRDVEGLRHPIVVLLETWPYVREETQQLTVSAVSP